MSYITMYHHVKHLIASSHLERTRASCFTVMTNVPSVVTPEWAGGGHPNTPIRVNELSVLVKIESLLPAQRNFTLFWPTTWRFAVRGSVTGRCPGVESVSKHVMFFA